MNTISKYYKVLITYYYAEGYEDHNIESFVHYNKLGKILSDYDEIVKQALAWRPSDSRNKLVKTVIERVEYVEEVTTSQVVFQSLYGEVKK